MPDDDVKPPEETTPPKEEAKKAEPSPEHMIPKSRFDEVSKRAQAYERFGTPEQLTAALNTLAYYQELERQAVAEAEKSTTGEPTDETAKKLQEANAALYQVEPKLAKAIKAGDFAEAHEHRCRLIATEATKDLLAESGIEADAATVMRYGKQLAPYFDPQENPALHALFFVDPEKAVGKAWKLWRADVAKSGEKERADEKAVETTRKLPRAPAVPGGSTTAGKAPPEASSDPRELERRLTAKLKAAVAG